MTQPIHHRKIIRVTLPAKKPDAAPVSPAGHGPAHAPKPAAPRKPGYAKIFQYAPPAGQTPTAVEIVGSFTGWKKLPLHRSSVTGTWQITVPDIQSNRTHHYMLLVDGHPASDKNCDGLAAPDGPQEAQYQLTTPRGPRVLMLFAQTK